MAVVLLLTGCSSTDLRGSGGSEVHLVQVESLSGGSVARVRVVRADEVSSNEAEWTVSSIDPSSSMLRMSWVDGAGPKCGEVDRLEVAENREAIVVGLTDTARDPDLDCAAVGALRRFTLQLRSPVGDRAVVEPTSGVNDGPPHFSSATPPVPTCSTNATPRDVPVGMSGAAQQLAPTSATAVTICRVAWPHGGVRTTQTRLTNPARVRQLADTINRAHDPRSLNGTVACTKRSRGAWYAAYFTAPRLQVEVFVDEINCGTITNGSTLASTTPAIHQALAAAF